ncbi:MAG TPA: nicotinate-nucleotide adenylyltransferase [Pirellulales bacterium]|nr:nicotinate-nucleotide adenylyltransferase [Pirellulales bacterium]
MRLGLFGGTFDPIHLGHLLLAEYCRQHCRLDAVWFLPAAEPPHKQRSDLTPAEQRVEMLELAIGGHEAFSVCTREIERGGVSYTVDTLVQLSAEDPARSLFFLLGGDSLVDLPRWREPARICELALPVVVARPGSPSPDYGPLVSLVSAERLEKIRTHQVEMPQIGISSREIRRRVAAGLSIRYQTPRAVEKYIEVAGLYVPIRASVPHG